jgi:hypothetical protein
LVSQYWLPAHHAIAIHGRADLAGAPKLDKGALRVPRVPVPQQQHILDLLADESMLRSTVFSPGMTSLASFRRWHDIPSYRRRHEAKT